MHTRSLVVLAGFAWLGAAGCRGGEEGRGADTETLAGVGSVTIWTQQTELFLEHPALLVGEPARFVVHLTALADFTPLDSGSVTFWFEAREGAGAVEVAQAAPSRAGIYSPMVTLPAAGRWDLRVSIESPQLRDVIRVPDLRAYEKDADLPEAEPEPEGGVTFLKEQQWQTPGFRSALAERGALPVSIEAPGEIVPAAGRYAEISAPVAGTVDPESARLAPAPGQIVEERQILTVLTPALGESGSALAAARAELRDAEQDYDRAKRLFEVEAVADRRVKEARIRLDAAREALAGLTGGGAVAADGRVTLRSPIAGVVARRELAPGSRVATGALLFAIVDPSVVWLRAHVPAAQAARIRADAGATFSLEGGGARLEATRSISVGSMVDPATRSVPVLYEIDNPDGSIKVGSQARVFVRTGEIAEGVLVADSAVIEEDGRPVAYVQTRGEHFERRRLALGPRAPGRVLVVRGIEPGERVVTGAAYQVRLASLSSAVPAHDHE